MVKELLARADKPGSTTGDTISYFFVRFFFSVWSLFFNTISPFGLFFFILTADPAGHALGSIYILSLSPEFYFGRGLRLVFYDNRNLKISKFKKSEQYKIEMFIRLCDEHFACHFESHLRET